MKDKHRRAVEALNQACEKRDAAYKALEDAADDLPADDLDALIQTFDTAQAEVERCKKQADQLAGIIEARENTPPIVVEEQNTSNTASNSSSAVVVASSGNCAAVAKGELKHELTYRPDTGVSFFRDLYRATKGDAVANERLLRHEVEMRDLTTTATDGGGFVPPLYMGELWANAPVQGRPFADSVTNRPLPAKGMNITLPRVTTAPATAVQATENATLQETELVEATVTIEVRTIGGFEDVSIQLLERSDPPIDDVVFLALRDSYNTVLDTQLLSGTGSSGQHMGLRAVTGVNTTAYTDASPTAAELVPKVYDAIQEVATNRFRNADMIVMHPRRAAWLASNLSSTFPLFQLGNLTQAAGTQSEGFIGSFSGLRVILDANIGTTYGASTNEDEIYVIHSQDMILWEGNLRAEVFRETLSGEATVRLRLYAFSAWADERYPSGISVISGTGLVTPTF